MSYRTKLHLINLVLWIVFFILYTVLFFIQTDASLDTAVNYRGNLSLIFIVPVIGGLYLLFLMHKKEKYDERNKKIEYLSGAITMITMMIVVFISLIVLHMRYLDSGMVPISWLWYLAFSNIFVVWIIFSSSNIILACKGSKYED